jgi:sialate O-acetylesterase
MRLVSPVALLCLLLALTTVNVVQADVKLPAVISDNMVLERDMKLPIWGTADPGESVTVTLGEQTATATADNDGRWSVKLASRAAGGPLEMTVKGKNSLTIKNILVGEVWICSGQSNMEWTVASSNNPKEEIAAANYPKIRLFTVPKKVSDEPQSDCGGKWVECSPSTVGGFSGVGYFFGRTLQQDLDVPVGLVNSSWGGTPAESWTTWNTLAANPTLNPITDQADQIKANLPKLKAQHAEKLAQWKVTAAKIKAEGKQPPRAPQLLDSNNPRWPAGLYNGMIAPLVPYAIRGAIWYQGEANAGRAEQYQTLLPAMITDWRRAFNEGDFPFLIVQLANFTDKKSEPMDDPWAELREAQTKTAGSLPNTGLALAIDIGEAKDIHPRNKQEVGRRLALVAERMTYGMNVVDSGPTYEGMKVAGSEIRITFKNVDGGLEAKGGDKLEGFAIAGADHKFVWAEATIEGNSVIVRSDKISAPVAVRYAWAANPTCNLYNKAGLPAVPFRTDDWPGITAGKR